MKKLLADERYTVRLGGNGFDMKFAVDEETLREVMTFLMEDTQQVSKGKLESKPRKPSKKQILAAELPPIGSKEHAPKVSSPAPKPPARSAPVPPGIATYLEACQARRWPDKITALGVYLHDYAGQATFTRAEITQAFAQANLNTSKNLSRDLLWAVKNGWLALSKGVRGIYEVTPQGRHIVAERFPYRAIETTRQGGRK